MHERMRIIRDKIMLCKNDAHGDKARAEFIQITHYNTNFLQRQAAILHHIVHNPEHEYGELALLCDVYGSDKGSFTDDESQHPYSPLPAHNYTDIYEVLFRHNGFKDNVNAVFECGIGTNNSAFKSNMTVNGRPGASLRVWRDFFKNAIIIGGDIDKNILFEEERIKTGYIDQMNPETITTFFAKMNIVRYDIMIDDGLHTYNAAKILFENSIHYLNDHGIYIIEDLAFYDIKKFFLFMKDKLQFTVKYLIMETPHRWNNNLIIIRKRI